MQPRVLSAAAAFLAVCGSFCIPLPAAEFPEFDTSRSELRPLIESFSSDRAILNRSYRIPSPTARGERFSRFYAAWLQRLSKLDFDHLSQDGKVDYIAFRNFLNRESARLRLDTEADAGVQSYVPFATAIVDLEQRRRALEPVNAAESARVLAAIRKQIEDARKKLEADLGPASAGPVPQERRVAANRAANRVTALRATLRGWFTFYNSYDPTFTWWNDEGFRTVDTALQNYITFLKERVAGLRPNDVAGSPIGREGLMNELAFEMIPYTPEELIDIANREFAWCENEMKKASREMGFGDDWKKALEKVKTMHVEPGKQPELVRDLAREAIAYVDAHNLVTVPALARETWRMEMMTPERQIVNPFFTGGEVISVSYPTSGMTFEQKMMTMRGNNIPFSRATVFHELIPGHHLQIFVADRYRRYRSDIGNTPFITEGWSLYWELLLYDMKFQKTPEDRIGAMFWRMHRCARIIFSLSFHLGRMTPEECINFLVDRVGHERENAAGEVRRSFAGEYGPLYQAAYLLGGMQLWSLRKELVGTGKMTDRDFHDAILLQNRIPVELIRAALTNQPLTRDYRTGWRFATP